MPQYLFSNPDNEDEVVEVTQTMNEPHIYSRDGKEWTRLWTKPQAAADTKFNPFDIKGSSDKIKNKKGNMGNLWDFSAELSDKRKDKAGFDALKEKAYENYSKRRKGFKHKDIVERESIQKLEKLGVKVEK